MRRFAGDPELTADELRDRPGALAAAVRARRRRDRALEGVGPKLAEAAAEAGISTLGDLLLRFPHSHRDRTVVPVAELEPGRQRDRSGSRFWAAPRGPFRKRGLSITSVKVGDDSGSLRASWFNQPWVAPKLIPGSTFLLTGSRDKRGFRVSEYELLVSGPRVLSQEEGALRAKLSSTRLLPRHPRERRRSWFPSTRRPSSSRRTDQAVGRAGDRPGAERGRGAAGRDAGTARAGRSRRRDARRRIFPTARTAPKARATASSSKSCSSTRRCWRPGSGPIARRARRRAWASRASWSPAGSTRCRSSRPPTSSPPSTRSTPTSTPASRCSGC